MTGVPVADSWTRWQPVAPALTITPRVLSELLDGGQAFRWWRKPDGSWLGQWGAHLVNLRSGEDTTLEWRTPVVSADATETALRSYLGGDGDQTAALDALPWRSDRHLAQCLHAFPGLRILRQPFAETLLCFLCSATKQIVQIKQMVALLARHHGQPVAAATGFGGNDAPIGHRLPTWEELAQVSEAELRRCLLGFRARYIKATADLLAASPGWLQETERLPYAEAKARLCELPGVGEKVADCVLLFGAGRLEAFPVDVWILKAMARRYALTGWSPSQIAHFGRTHFGAAAGLAQQYLFAFEREAG